ncbi:hypothetical protein [Rhodopila globiformis]|uniref:Uncharacterized protein n=1 Tax=Rhodopila globiformis TaxID=1071 RepID=A0A2S6NHQ3_RHOGL|nr:hypothetical protein [Rhodopila globiformis]PPQ34133.1 hypothetical protein CCS01_12175 [Rhodopila globiformis]
MDTHIHPDPGNTASVPLHVSLPEDVFDLERGKSDAETAGAPQAPSASPEERLSPREEPRPPRRRGLLLGTAACLLVLGIGAACVFSPYNTAYPVPMMASTLRQLANEAGIGQPAVLAPSAHLARVNAPPLPPPGKRETYTPAPRKSEVDEILALRAGAPAGASADTPTPPAHSAAPADNPVPAFLPGEPGGPPISSNPATIAAQQPSTVAPKPEAATPSPAAKPDLTQSIVAGMRNRDGAPGNGAPAAQVASSAAPVSLRVPEPQKPLPVRTHAQTQSQPDTAAASPQADAATLAATLQAAPMSTPEQVQVLELVTRLGALVDDQRKEVDQLRADLARSRVDETARIDDFQRRLAFAEAQRSVAKASGVAADPAPATPIIPVSEPATSVVRPTLVVARAALPADPSQPVQRYRVQAASPGLAMLAAIDRAGDESAQLQVALGDTVPGYGRVKAVVQQGTTWVVKTERGTIGQ